ncbi:hypothetical protein Nepgr_018981 [Nepenthes gracilis]|uniref:Cytochrome P450 n=1 Tax=Nepenthes gracilis TaxID=150966 RepID=A0AAD3SUD9_NEPGR|nr:hypothetical protein Nepgr_018981 [Nepenthes gracilis]
MNLLNGLLHLSLVWIFISLLFFLVGQRHRTRVRNLPPGPSFLTTISDLLHHASQPHKYFAALANIYGHVMTIQLGCVRTVVVSSISTAKEVLQTKDASFSYRNPSISYTFLGHDKATVAFSSPTSYWRNLRKIFKSHIFSSSKLDVTQGLRKKEVQRLLSYIENCCKVGIPVNISEVIFTTTLNFLLGTFFSSDSTDHGSDTSSEIRELIRSIIDVIGELNFADYFPPLKLFDSQGIERRTTILVGKFTRIISAMIACRLQSRKAADYGEDKDALDVLLSICDDTRNELEQSHIPHLILELLIGGTNTTTTTVEWVMAELLRKPKMFKKAQAELEDVVGKGNLVEEDDIARLPYLRPVVKETFRMHPPVPFLIPRKVIIDVELSGFTVPKNTQVLVNIWAIGRDESLWENANMFEPDRFMGLGIDVKGHHFELLPFGAGCRICPGLPMADRMVHLMLGTLIHSFDWKLAGGITPESMRMDDKVGFNLRKA